MSEKSMIIPIASGKGGVGKSVLTANLAISLANSGYSTVAVDLDLGGSNLYSHFGLKNTNPGIGDYLNNKKHKLTDYLIQTNVENLKFLPGDGKVAFMANMPYAQKTKLIREINNLQADFVLLDLGAGTSFNTLDYFRLSKNGVVITTFEKPSIMNTLTFLKNFIFRIVQKEVGTNKKLSAILKEAYKNSNDNDPMYISRVIDLIKDIDEDCANRIKNNCTSYHPRIIFNKGEHPDDLFVADHLAKTVQKILSIELCFFGFVFYDENVIKSTRKSRVLLNEFPETIASKGVISIANRIAKFRDKTIANSNELLIKDTIEKFELWEVMV